MNFSIELAPNWKRGLTLNHPVMIVTPSWDSSPVGAIVTPPLTARLRARAADPRVIDLPGGFLLNSRAANPGVSQFVEQHQRAWEKSVTPIIVALAAQAADDWAKLAARLERAPGVSGIELHLNPVVDAVSAIQQTRAATDLPILTKLDLENARAIARACLDAGANALVISRAPRGARVIEGKIRRGRMYGPFVQPMVLNALNEIAALKLGAPLIACGGIHSVEDVRAFLSAGADAVEIDTAHWVDAASVARLCEEIAGARDD